MFPAILTLHNQIFPAIIVSLIFKRIKSKINSLKTITLFIFLFFSSIICISQAKITRPTSRASYKTIKDFGAIPNDGKDDTWAFIKAGKYFSNLWDINGVPLKEGKVNFSYASNSARLEIPSGTYLVGKQIDIPAEGISTTYGKIFGYPKATATLKFSGDGSFKTGLELLKLSNSKNNIDQVVIKGTGSVPPVIKYNDGLWIGFFNNKGVPLFLTDNDYNPRYRTSIATFITIESCKNIVLENIEIDGNNIAADSKGKTTYGGGYGKHLLQTGASGTYIINTKNVSLNKLNIHHMTLDGIMYQDYYKDPQKFPKQLNSNVTIKNVVCNYNRRQGFSWVGGRSLLVENSKFNNTGVLFTGIAAGNPGAGVDIEPEEDPNGNKLWCIDGRFINCDFINNKGNALVNDLTWQRTLSVSFDDCTFHDVEGYAVWVKGRTITFNNCKIWGGFVHGNEGSDPDEVTRFNKCDFADEEMPGRPGVYNEGFALFESWDIAKGMKFNDCSFRTVHENQRLVTITTASSLEKEFTVFSNCSFTAGPSTKGNENIFFGCVFDKNTKMVNLNPSNVETFFLNGVVFAGSNNAGAASYFSTDGKLLLSAANTNGKQLKQFVLGRYGIGTNNLDGYLNFSIGSKSCLYTYWDQTIDIGKNASFINTAGGQFVMLSGTINNHGRITLEDGSNTAFMNPVSINTRNKAMFYYNKNANLQLDQFWNKRLGSLGNGRPIEQMKMNPETKFSGGNAAIPSGRKAL